LQPERDLRKFSFGVGVLVEKKELLDHWVHFVRIHFCPQAWVAARSLILPERAFRLSTVMVVSFCKKHGVPVERAIRFLSQDWATSAIWGNSPQRGGVLVQTNELQVRWVRAVETHFHPQAWRRHRNGVFVL